jgi:alkaline phosphatase D
MRIWFSISFLCAWLIFENHANAESIHIAFGSCSHQDKPQPIWQSVVAEKPDMFIFLGDNIYGDSSDMDVLAAKYAKLNAIPGVQAIRNDTQVVATWDDHDYGENDAGAEFSAKAESRELMLEFWGEPKDSPRWTQEGGIYTSYLLGETYKVQIILLDTRWNRTPLLSVSGVIDYGKRLAQDRGPYLVNPDVNASLLGEAQWHWLEGELKKDVDARVIATSIQLLPEFSGWESWANFPLERQRMLSLLDKYQAEPVVFISGDVHWAEFSSIAPEGSEEDREWPLIELTSSGLTEEWTAVSPNVHRVGEAYPIANYGNIEFNTDDSKSSLLLSIKDVEGEVLIEQRFDFPTP